MKTFLLVKTSSLGDVIHNLPVASDIRAMIPQSRVDWVVEEDYADVPRLHSAVQDILPVAIRRWRKTLHAGATRREIGRFLDALRSRTYDAVIDTQGLLKSALIAYAARGPGFGLDWRSAREPLALFYEHTYSVSWAMHAVERNRTLAARALQYTLPDGVDYGIRAAAGQFPWLAPNPYAVLLHATSQHRKLWSEACWTELGRGLAAAGRRCVLPWHGTDERARSERLAGQIPAAIVPPALGLAEMARLLAGAQAVAGVDTGLTHLAAAIGIPTVGIYCATDPAATGLYEGARALNLGGIGQAPAASEVAAALERLRV